MVTTLGASNCFLIEVLVILQFAYTCHITVIVTGDNTHI